MLRGVFLPPARAIRRSYIQPVSLPHLLREPGVLWIPKPFALRRAWFVPPAMWIHHVEFPVSLPLRREIRLRHKDKLDRWQRVRLRRPSTFHPEKRLLPRF